MYMLVLLDTYAPTYGVLVIALFECVAIAWIYGLSTDTLYDYYVILYNHRENTTNDIELTTSQLGQ